MTPRIAVLIPCYNEQAAVPAVIRAFQAALPGAAIHVYDNNSTDSTVAVSGIPQSPTTFWKSSCSWPVHASRCLRDTRRYTL